MYIVSNRQLILGRCKTAAERLKIEIKVLGRLNFLLKVSDGLRCHRVLNVQQAFVHVSSSFLLTATLRAKTFWTILCASGRVHQVGTALVFVQPGILLWS